MASFSRCSKVMRYSNNPTGYDNDDVVDDSGDDDDDDG